MKNTLFVFVNKHGHFYSTRTSARTISGDRVSVFNSDFNMAEVFSSVEVANKHRDGIINTGISKEMHLFPLDAEINERDLFRVVLKGD